MVYVSLDVSSPTRTGRGGTDDVLQVFPAPLAVAIPYHRLDIGTPTSEEIDAITGYDPGPGLLPLLVGLPAQQFGMLMGDLEEIGDGGFAYYGIFDRRGYRTEVRPGPSAEPFEVVLTLPAGFRFDSPWHVIKGALRPFDRGTSLASSTQARLDFFESTPTGLSQSTVVSTGDPIPGLGTAITGFYRCGLSSVGPWDCYSSGVLNSSGAVHWSSFCDDATGSWNHRVTWAKPGDVVGTRTIQSLDRMDGATDPDDPDTLNFYGAALTTGSEAILLHRSVSAGPSGPGWGPMSVVIDSSTPVPNATGQFSFFGPIAAQSAAFHGRTTTSREGIYKLEDGVLRAIADQTTVVPGGNGGTFGSFGDDISNDDGWVTFIGSSAAGTGIYTDLYGRLQKVVQVNDGIEERSVSGVRLERDALSGNLIAFGVRFSDQREGLMVREFPEPFDPGNASQRAIHVDVELDPDPAILGPTPRALLLGDLGTVRLRGIWTSNGTTGTVRIPDSEVLRLIALQFGTAPTGNVGEWVTTIDVASGAVLSSSVGGTLNGSPFGFDADTNGGPWTSPQLGAIPGTAAGFETDANGRKLFCSSAFSQVGGAGCDLGTLGFPPAANYDRRSGFVHLTGPLTLGGAALWGFPGDQRWLEAPAGSCPDLDSDGVCDAQDPCPYYPVTTGDISTGTGAATRASAPIRTATAATTSPTWWRSTSRSSTPRR